MAGLREKQKADRHRRIIDSASTLFGQVGYDAARIDAIAELAELSVGTFYNYFETKADLLLAIVSMEVEEVLSQGEGVLVDPPDEPLAALGLLIRTYYGHSLVYLTKDMWRSAMAMAIQQPEAPFSRRYRELDAALAEQVCRLIEKLRLRGDLRSDLQSRPLGELAFNDLNALFTEFILDEEQSLDQLQSRLQAHLTALASLIVTKTQGAT
ncbi:TetR/AcrR family transcriptional regulator [Paracoccus sp. MBLB3053]|uniref:TetR/AcrR family transcriptional regulator n=1 Tax=Paracoccus aurantius TaxID=3073814 RepID=A0ABU2HSX2_9RHOB|nr:TetR/AcrR family transcriptional regulator [Paracoccus sp. MBLB3053]MDS9467852.1 TetR/AcrR family transcriptional regulator [Paracoccus sp. MBLB3053]